jgi:predicted GNAT family acetyltransferase
MDARLFRPLDEDAPPGWETLSARPIMQMIADPADLPGPVPGEKDTLRLSIDNAAEMLELATLAKPGPFAPRTALLGRYIGIREVTTGRLVAMGGERFRMRGHVEISAIAVHPNDRRRGYGAALTAALARAAIARDEMPFLHVYEDNPAVLLYARLGFRERQKLWVLLWRRLSQ